MDNGSRSRSEPSLTTVPALTEDKPVIFSEPEDFKIANDDIDGLHSGEFDPKILKTIGGIAQKRYEEAEKQAIVAIDVSGNGMELFGWYLLLCLCVV